jgi:hypothetical protein
VIWYVVAFVAGMVFMWKWGWWLFGKVVKKGWKIEHTLKTMSPDSFQRLRRAVDSEASRRNSLQ